MLLQKNLNLYLLQHPTHRVHFNTSTILGSENNTARLLILKSSDLNNDFRSSTLIIFKFLLHFTYMRSQFTYFLLPCYRIVGSNFHIKNVLLPYLQSATYSLSLYKSFSKQLLRYTKGSIAGLTKLQLAGYMWLFAMFHFCHHC